MTEQIAPGTVVLGEEFSQHRIFGDANALIERGLPSYFDVPLISHVKDGLWQGGSMGGVELPEGFDFVLSLYPWEQYVLPAGCERTEVTMYDSLDQTFEQVPELANEIIARLDEGQTVLVHCQAGLNRSGLIAAAVLIGEGYDPEEAIALLREKRSPAVLCNMSFEKWLLSLYETHEEMVEQQWEEAARQYRLNGPKEATS